MTIYTTGSFKSTGVAVNIPVPNGSNKFMTTNLTQAATTATPGTGFRFEWFANPTFASNSALEFFKSNGTNVSNANVVTPGFTYLTDFPQPQAAVVGTAITAATPAVVTMTNTYSNGDNVVLYNTVGMEIIGGMTFTISSVSGSAFSLLGLAAAGFAAPATAVTARRVNAALPVLPEFLYVTAISQAAQAVVTVSQDPTNTIFVGQKLVFSIPTSFGMVDLSNNNLAFANINAPVVVTAVNYAAYQFTINLNTTNFSAFAFPASTNSPTTPAFATVAPQGASTTFNPVLQTFTGYDFNKQPFRSSSQFPLMNLQAGAQAPAGQNNDIIVWENWSAPVSQYAANA